MEETTLSYDDDVPYEEQHGPEPDLASRIGASKLYLLSENSTGGRSTTRKRKIGEDEEEDTAADDDIEMALDSSYRENAILLQGPPVSHLPTARLFAYVTHFDLQPMGLEWIDDTTCVFVFETNAAARTGLRYLQRSTTENPDAEGFVTAKPIPIALWPPEEQIHKSLGKGEGLHGVLRMRKARNDDIKKRGAQMESEFYRKHGRSAGKELFNGRELPGANKRQRREDSMTDAELQASLDADLDAFLAEGDDEVPSEVPTEADSSPGFESKMRSDNIAADGRTLLESDNDPALLARIAAAPSRRDRRPAARNGSHDDRRRGARRTGTGNGATRTEARSRKTQQELDDELDAFLKEGET